MPTATSESRGFTVAVRALVTVGLPRPLNQESTRRGAGRLAGLEAFATEHRPSLSGAERNGGFTAALGTDSGRFDAAGRTSPVRRAVLPFGLARLTALRFVSEFLFVIELLFTGGKDEVGAAVHALQNPILKIRHGTTLVKDPERISGAPADALRLLGADIRCSTRQGVRYPALFNFAAAFLPVTFAGQSLFNPQFLAWLQIERMAFDLFDDVFLLHFSFEAPKGVFQGLTFLESDFCQKLLHLQTDHRLYVLTGTALKSGCSLPRY